MYALDAADGTTEAPSGVNSSCPFSFSAEYDFLYSGGQCIGTGVAPVGQSLPSIENLYLPSCQRSPDFSRYSSR